MIYVAIVFLALASVIFWVLGATCFWFACTGLGIIGWFLSGIGVISFFVVAGKEVDKKIHHRRRKTDRLNIHGRQA